MACPARWRRASFAVGRWTVTSGAASADMVALGAALCRHPDPSLRADALVTGPICKAAWEAAGVGFPGHTEYLARLAEADGEELMLLAGGGLRVALATTHLPLARVPEAINASAIVRAGHALARGLRDDLGCRGARLGILGLNPHAGEEGRLGREEAEIIAPAVAALRAGGVDASGPLPADSAFARARRGEFDALLAMYHDQGLGPLKTAAAGRGVNVTLGLPLVRTSPDHGAAFDRAGRRPASPASALEALRLAVRVARRRRRA